MGIKNNSRKPANDGFSASNQANKKQQGSKKMVLPVVCMVLVFALLAGVIVFNKIGESGYFYRNTVSVSSDNYDVNNAMLSYFFNSQYQQMANSLQQMGVKLDQNLKDQTYAKDQSWFDFIMESYTIPQVEQILVLCEAAKKAGFEMDEHTREHIDEAIKSVEEMAANYAKQYGGSEEYYIRNMYGYGVSIDDIRDAIELNQLAAAYSQHLTDSYKFSEAEWDKYLEENKADFQVIDYVSYTFTAKKPEATATTTTAAPTTTPKATEVAGSSSDETTTAATTAKKEETKLTPEKQEALDNANALCQQLNLEPKKALEIFNTTVEKYLNEEVYASEKDDKKREEKVKADLEATVVEGVANDQTNEFLKFAFGDKRENDAYITKDDTNGKYTVYLITKAPYIEEYTTRNIRVIALSGATGDKIAEERDAIIKEFEKGDKSEKLFAELAKKNSDDSTAHETGGLFENQGRNDLEIASLNDWLYAKDRKVGDYTSASNGKTGTEENIFIIYYVGEGLKKSHRDVDSVMVSEAYDADYTKLEKAHKVEINREEAYKIPSQAGLN